jgi:hypothetical protein
VRHRSEPELLVLHSLRVKGFAEPGAVAEATALAEAEAAERLSVFRASELVGRRDGRISGFFLLPRGKELHAELLDQDRVAADAHVAVERAYSAFLDHNETFKVLCTDWQLRTVAGKQVPNDHGDWKYDAAIAARLTRLQPLVAALLDELAAALTRFGPYTGRLRDAVTRFNDGDASALARPLSRSYHDVWMELHEDFLVTLDRDRSAADGF